MIATLLADERPRGRKHHRCYDCGRWIAPGEVHRKTANVFDGRAYTLRQHLDCYQMGIEARRGDDCWEGIPPLWDDELVWEELCRWRGRFPHVVCRLELSQQLAEIRRQDRRRDLEGSET